MEKEEEEKRKNDKSLAELNIVFNEFDKYGHTYSIYHTLAHSLNHSLIYSLVHSLVH